MQWLAWPLAIALPISGVRKSLQTKTPVENATAQTAEQKKLASLRQKWARGVWVRKCECG